MMDPDRARDGDDRLGFGEVAEKLSLALGTINLSKGFVVAIEGPWGSGKSSLVEMALKNLGKRQDGPVSVSFSPWLVGNRNDLLTELFNQLAEKIDETAPEQGGESAKQLLRRFAKVARGAAFVAKWASVGSMPGSSLASDIANSFAESADKLSETSLAELKHGIERRLKGVRRPIIVFIDDLDRLDPAEAVEVLRLVRAVADFPNVCYLLAYDVEVLSRNLESALGIQDGRAYLEKIVQVSFHVPEALGFDLLNWLSRDAESLFPDFSWNEASSERFNAAINHFGRIHISTPRDVVRIVNAMKLYATPVRDRIDPGDMVFLQIIRLKDPELYKWVSEYVRNLAAIGDGAHMEKEDAAIAGRRLGELINNPNDGANYMLQVLSEILPGIQEFMFDDVFSDPNASDKYPKVYGGFSNERRVRLGRDRRLASPDHYRLYFAFSEPPGRVGEEEFAAFIKLAVVNTEDASKRFLAISRRERPQGGTLSQLLLDKLIHAELTSDEARGVLLVLGEAHDCLGRDFEEASQTANFYQGDRVQNPFIIIEKIDKSERRDLLSDLFRNSRSISWLLRCVLKSAFQHNPRLGDAGERSLMLSLDEHEFVRTTFLERLDSIDPQEIKRAPHLRGFFLDWMLIGDPEAARRCAADLSVLDEDFLELLWRLRTHVRTNGSTRFPLVDTTLNKILDGVDGVRARLEGIALQSDLEMARQARALLDLIERDPFAEV